MEYKMFESATGIHLCVHPGLQDILVLDLNLPGWRIGFA